MGKNSHKAACGKDGSKSPFEIYRDDRVYSLTIRQHAALAYALTGALDRIADPKDRDSTKEDITNAVIFRNRYLPTLRQADAETGFCWKAEIGKKASAAKATEAEKEAEIEKQYLTNLCGYLKDSRNYFAHYLHTPDKIIQHSSDKTFRRFIELLRSKAVEMWRQHHMSWNEPKGRHTDTSQQDLATAIRDFDWKALNCELKKLTPHKDALPIPDLLLFISIFLPKGRQTRLLSSMYGFKESHDATEDQQQSVRQRREVLSALCLREAHDLQSGQQAVIATLTILDKFAHRFGKQEPSDNFSVATPKPPLCKELPDICKSYRHIFFIKMAVAMVEAHDILPGIRFARAMEGRPSFEEKDKNRNLYIVENSTAISFEMQSPGDSSTRHFGQLGIHALKVVLLAWLNDADPATSAGCIKDLIIDVGEVLKPGKKQPTDVKEQFQCALPAAFTAETAPPLTNDADYTEPLRSKLRQIIADRFSPTRFIPIHKKATTVLWWINLRLPSDKKLNKDAYTQALLALSGAFNLDEFAACLPELSRSELNMQGQTLKSWVKEATSLDVLYTRVQADFFSEEKAAFPDGVKAIAASTDKAILERVALLVGLRKAKKSVEIARPAQQESWQLFCNRFSRAASPPAHYLWDQLLRDNYTQVLNQNTNNFPIKKKPADRKRLPFGRAINLFLKTNKHYNTLADIDRSLYEWNNNGRSLMTERAKECFTNDRLLLALVHKTIQALAPSSPKKNLSTKITLTDMFRYSAEIPVTVNGNVLTLTIQSGQARRSYVSITPDRIANVIKSYWLPRNPSQHEVPFFLPRETERKPGGPPASWLEAESDMEYERSIMIQAILDWEKELVLKKAKSENINLAEPAGIKRLIGCIAASNSSTEPPEPNSYIDLNKLLLTCLLSAEESNIQDYCKIRNHALHSAAETTFSSAPGLLKGRYGKISTALEEKRKRDKETGQKRAGISKKMASK